MNVWTLSRGYGNNFGSMRNSVSNFGLLDEFENAFVRLQGTWNQDLIQPQEFALQRLPDLTLTGRKELFDNLMFADYDAQAVNFFRYEGFDGWRFDINPRVTLPWRFGDYLTGYATLGSQGFVYSPSGHTVPITPVGSNAATQFNNGVSTTGLTHFTNASAVPYFKTGVSTVLDRVY